MATTAALARGRNYAWNCRFDGGGRREPEIWFADVDVASGHVLYARRKPH